MLKKLRVKSSKEAVEKVRRRGIVPEPPDGGAESGERRDGDKR
jgi:hypothetical protein